jgi:hypothetical protein
MTDFESGKTMFCFCKWIWAIVEISVAPSLRLAPLGNGSGMASAPCAPYSLRYWTIGSSLATTGFEVGVIEKNILYQ